MEKIKLLQYGCKKWLQNIPRGVSMSWQNTLNTILQISSRSSRSHSWNFYCWAVLWACLLKLQMTESQESLEVYWRTELEFNFDQKNGLRKSQYNQVKVSTSYCTQEKWTHWGDDAKFCRKHPGYRGCQNKEETRLLYCPTTPISPMQTQGKAEGRDTPNRERTFQLSCQMSEIPMEIYRQ